MNQPHHNEESILQTGQTVLHYTILGLIAEGGMAEVYLARDNQGAQDNIVVLKRVRPNLQSDPRFETMFDNEAHLASLIDHPNVVRVFGIKRCQEGLFLAMEFLNGKNLLAIGKTCDTGGFWIPHVLLARIIAGAAAGLHHAHMLRDKDGTELKLVHRDMSPENIVVTYNGQPKLVDFGVAKARLTPDTTQHGVVKGKLNYLSPEAIRGFPLDSRADIYALGVTCYLFLTARFPYVATSTDKLIDMMFSEDPPPPRTINERVPKQLEKICMRCLAREPQDRYQTADDLREAMEGFIAKTSEAASNRHVAAFVNQLYPKDSDPMRCWVQAITGGEAQSEVPNIAPEAEAPKMQRGGTMEMAAGFTGPDIWSLVTDIHKRAGTIVTNLEASGVHVALRANRRKLPDQPKSERLPPWSPPSEESKGLHTASLMATGVTRVGGNRFLLGSGIAAVVVLAAFVTIVFFANTSGPPQEAVLPPPIVDAGPAQVDAASTKTAVVKKKKRKKRKKKRRKKKRRSKKGRGHK